MNKVLWLASWFPNKNNPYTGDFIERHAQATSLFIPVHVLHCYQNKKGLGNNRLYKRSKDFKQLHIQVNEYSSAIFSIPILGSIFSFCYSLFLYNKLTLRWVKENGRPTFIHIHVSLRCGLVALYLKKIRGINFIITEHYAGYLQEASNYGYTLNFLHKYFLKIILRNASSVTTVSNYSAQSLKRIVDRKYDVIYNVFDKSVFNLMNAEVNSKKFTFIHISTLTAQKNIEIILRAIQKLKISGVDFIFKIIGPIDHQIKESVRELKIDGFVVLLNEMPPSELANHLKTSHCLILYSNFESFGCVNIEALACGKPLIVSNLEVFSEYIENGMHAFVGNKDSADELALLIQNMMNQYSTFKPSLLNAMVQSKFSYNIIGEQFFNLYSSIKN